MARNANDSMTVAEYANLLNSANERVILTAVARAVEACRNLTATRAHRVTSYMAPKFAIEVAARLTDNATADQRFSTRREPYGNSRCVTAWLVNQPVKLSSLR